MGDNGDFTNGNSNWKTLAARWLFQQGTSTVLLFAILVALWYGFPWWVQKVQLDFVEIRADHKAERTEWRNQYDSVRKESENARKEYMQSVKGLEDAIKQIRPAEAWR